MCRWCRKLEPILARESYPFPLRPLTPKLHALHGAASHRLGIFYRNRLLIMTDLLQLVQPLEKWHLDMGLVKEVRDEILYLQKGLERHPVERDEERGWEATKERMRNKRGGKGKGNKGKEREVVEGEHEEGGSNGEEGSEAGSERSRSAVVSGSGRHDEDKDNPTGVGRSAHSDADNEDEAEPHPPDHPPTHSSSASDPPISTAPKPQTHTAPGSPKPKAKNPHKEQALPGFKLRNPWRAYIEDLVAAKVLEHLEWQKQTGAGVVSLGPASHGGALNPVPEIAEYEDAPRHPPIAAAGSTGDSVRAEGTVISESGVARPQRAARAKGKRRGKLVAWVKAATKRAMEPPTAPPASKHGKSKTKSKSNAKKPKDRYINGPKAVKSVGASSRGGPGRSSGRGAGGSVGSGGRSGRGSRHESDEEDPYEGSVAESRLRENDGDGRHHEDEHEHGDTDEDEHGDGHESEHESEHVHHHDHHDAAD